MNEQINGKVQSDHIAKIVSEIEEGIVLGLISPRQKLNEDEFISRYGLKRHVVRQILGHLESVGLVERIKNRGAFVKSLTPDEVEQLYFMRELLERTAGETIRFPLDRATIDELWTLQKTHAETVELRNLRLIFRTNNAFHQRVFSLCDNTYLIEDIANYAQRVHCIRSICVADEGIMRQAVMDHEAIVEALAEGDRPQLIELIHKHIMPAKTRYLELYRASDGWG